MKTRVVRAIKKDIGEITLFRFKTLKMNEHSVVIVKGWT